jgi:hypothetical protein
MPDNNAKVRNAPLRFSREANGDRAGRVGPASDY